MDAIQDIRRYELLPPPDPLEPGVNHLLEDEYADERVGPPPHLEAISMRLLPLRHIESLLIAKLVPPNEDEATRLGTRKVPRHLAYTSNMDSDADFEGDEYRSDSDSGPERDRGQHLPSHHRQHSQQPLSYRHQPEIFVRPTGTSWKGTLKRYGRPNSMDGEGREPQDESQVVINECRQAMIALWNDKTVKEVLRKRKIRLEESPGL